MEHIIRRDLGNDSYKTGDFDTAVGHYTLAIGCIRAEIFDKPSRGKLKVLLSSYYASRAAALTKLKQYDLALEDCNLALEFDQNAIKAYQRKARVYMHLGIFDKSIEAYDEAIKIDAEVVAAEREHTETTKRKFEVAKATIEQQRTSNYGENVDAAKRAERNLKTVLKFCPDFDEARVLQVEAMYYAGDNTEAYQLASSLVKEGFSKNPDLLLLRVRLMLNKGKIDDALKQLWVLSRKKTDDARVSSLKQQVELVKNLMEQGDAAYTTKDYLRAIRFYSTAIDSCPDEAHGLVAKLMFYRGAAHTYTGAHHKAIDDYDTVLKYDPDHVKANLRKGSSLLAIKGGDREKTCQLAVQSFQRALEICEPTPMADDVKQQLMEAQRALLRSKLASKDYFAVLGVSAASDLAEIYNAYRVRALRMHNIKHAAQSRGEIDDAERQARDISEAYELLSEAARTGALTKLATATGGPCNPARQAEQQQAARRPPDHDQRSSRQQQADCFAKVSETRGCMRAPAPPCANSHVYERRLLKQHSDPGSQNYCSNPTQSSPLNAACMSPVSGSSPRKRGQFPESDGMACHFQTHPEYESHVQGSRDGGISCSFKGEYQYAADRGPPCPPPHERAVSEDSRNFGKSGFLSPRQQPYGAKHAKSRGNDMFMQRKGDDLNGNFMSATQA